MKKSSAAGFVRDSRLLRSTQCLCVAVLCLAIAIAPVCAAPPATGQAAAAKSDGAKATKPDAAGAWKKISPNDDVWINNTTKQVKISGDIVLREGPLELFACLKQTKEHEAIVACTTKAYVVHTALLAVGAVSGQPVQFRPEYKPAQGTEVEVTVEWTDAEGKTERAKAQEWIRNVKTGKALDQSWVFGGSGFYVDETTGEKFYQAESGDFICVSNFPSAMLDLPIKSSDSDAALLFEAFTDRIPPVETKVTLYLAPKHSKDAANKVPAGGREPKAKIPPALRPVRPAAPAT